jgi:hypothetical protein
LERRRTMAEGALIMWADSEDEHTPERREAADAVSDILAMLGTQAGGVVLERMIQRIFLVQGVAERRGYDLGWNHCEASIRE